MAQIYIFIVILTAFMVRYGLSLPGSPGYSSGKVTGIQTHRWGGTFSLQCKGSFSIFLTGKINRLQLKQ
jgi:hypothetical protein